MRASACLVVALVGLIFVSGCGPEMAPVKGRITCAGKPVANAAVTFSPVPASETDKEPGKPATGFTDEDGRYELSTYKARDGALVGEHRVLVMIDDTNPARCKRTKQLTLPVKPGTNEHNIELDPR
jgi:hypothetical protein